MCTKYLLLTLAAFGAIHAWSQVPLADQSRVSHQERGSIAATAVSHSYAEDRDRTLALVAILGAPLLPPVGPQEGPSPSPAGKRPTVAQASQQHGDEGDRIFQQNCSRCHNAPDGFSPRISGAIVRHMRVRASLSKHDEEELLHFFNP